MLTYTERDQVVSLLYIDFYTQALKKFSKKKGLGGP